MKRFKAILSVIFALLIALAPAFVFTTYAADDSAGNYNYTFKVKVNNACNSKDMDKDAVNVLFFEFTYKDKNGFGSEHTYKYDMSWSGKNNRNSDFLWEHFIRSNDNSYDTEFDMALPGKLSKMYIKLNMDGGERLSFEVNGIYCNGKRINSNTDYVSSAYSDSKANIYSSMEASVVDKDNSPYFQTSGGTSLTQTELRKIVNEFNSTSENSGTFRDQYNAVIDLSVLEKCIGSSDGDINQYYSHSDEASMYKYTFWFNVKNSININDADVDEVEIFYIEMHYKDQNGYGSEKTYMLNMAYDSGLKRNRNQNYLSYFERYDDNGGKVHFDIWVPGILTKVNMKLNMSGERLNVQLEKITLNSIAVNTGRDYVSSVYFNSTAEIKCKVPSSKIAAVKEELDSPLLRDQYGAIVSDTLLLKAKSNPDRYLYR